MSPVPGDLAYQNRGRALLAYLIALACITVLAICIRFYSRFVNHKPQASRPRLWWDDWTALAAVPLILGTLACGFIMVHFGLGQHIWNVPKESRVPLMKAFFAAQMIYPAAMGSCRESALFFCSRVFRTNGSPKWFRIALYVTHALNISWAIAITVDKVFICRPVAKNWDRNLPGKCSAVSSYWLGSAISSVVIDLMILLLPMPIIWTLNFSKGRKLALSTTFACGYCVIIISVGRVIVIMRQQEAMAADLTSCPLAFLVACENCSPSKAHRRNLLTSLATDSAPPVMYWLFGESPMTLLSICLPATLHLGARYMSILAPFRSMIKSRFDSHGPASASWNSQFSESREGSNFEEKVFPTGFHGAPINPCSSRGYWVHTWHPREKARSEKNRAAPIPEHGIHVQTTVSISRSRNSD